MTRCMLCGHDLHPTEVATCVRCLGRVRAGLVRIEQLFVVLPSLLVQLQVGYDLCRTDDPHRLPAEDVLTMLGPGSSSHFGHESDPPAVAFELGQWEDIWRQDRGEPAAMYLATVPLAVTYLSSRAGWAAAHHMAFDQFAADVKRIVGWLEEATGTVDRPERGAPCIYCRDTLLERGWTDEGRVDDWICPRCWRSFPEAHYRLAIRMALEDEAERMQA